MELFKILGKIAIDSNDANKALDDASSKGEKAHSKLSSAFSKIGGAAVAVGKTVATGFGVAATAVAGLVSQSVQSYAEYEQLVGGVETLFRSTQKSYAELSVEMSAQGKSLDEINAKWKEYNEGVFTVTDNAAEAYKTAGMSANDYMSTVTSFSASLIQSLGGDTAKAAEYAHVAILDMSDNANKMGSDIETLKTAYAGFAKQNYTMLDNLKLGYGGTKEEMQRLLADAEKLSGQKFDISSYADVVQAIHVIQEEMGVAGATAKEAATTIEGSLNMTKAAWQNVLTAMADEEADLDGTIKSLVDSVSTFAENLIPRIMVALNGVSYLVKELGTTLMQMLPEMLNGLLPTLIDACVNLLDAFIAVAPNILASIMEALPALIDGVTQLVVGLIDALPIFMDRILDGLMQSLPALIDGIVQMVVAICNELPNIIEVLVTYLPSMITMIVDALLQNLPILIEGLVQMVVSIVEYMPIIIQALVDESANIIGLIVTALLENLPVLIMGLIDMVAAIVAALPDILSALFNAVPAQMTAIWEAIKEVFAPVVEWFGEKWDAVKEKTAEIWETIKTTISDAFTAVKDWIGEKIQAVKDVFTSLWESIKSIWDTICQYVEFGVQIIASILDAAFQIITLPFRFIWENCKEYVFAAWEWIKEKIDSAISKIKEIVQIGFNFVKENIINPITDAKNKVVEKINELKEKAQEKITQLKNKATETFNSIKEKIITPINNAKNKAVEAFNNLRSQAQEKINSLKEKVTSTFNTIKEKIQTPITNAKNKVVEIFNTLKSNVTSKIDSIKSTVTSKFNDIKQKIQEPIEKAKDKVKEMIDKIKGFFDDLKLKLPHIKLPHFKLVGEFSLENMTVPHLSIEWYKKAMNAPMLLNDPTIFGYNPATGQVRGAGEAGEEVVSGASALMRMIKSAVNSELDGVAYYLQKLIDMLADYFPELIAASGHDIVTDDGTIVGYYTPKIDRKLGELQKLKERGR